MRRMVVRAVAALAAIACACSGAARDGDARVRRDDAPARATPATSPAGPSAPPATAGVKAPASKRLLGRWEMKLNDAPKEALAKEFQRFKSSTELANMVRVEYTVTDTDWVLHKYGAGGVYEQRWTYQVLQENGDVLLLERSGDDGEPQRVEVKVGEDAMVIATGNGVVPLRRLK